MEVHESLINNNRPRFYLGTVERVSRIEMSEVEDAVGNKLNTLEIIFNVGDLIQSARAIPLELNSEVKEGDRVIIFSFENIYNNTFYYHPIRFISEDNETVSMKYGNSIIEFQPLDETNTDLILADGKNIIVISPESERVNIKSGFGGIKLDASEGQVDIRNEEQSLAELMKDFIDILTEAKVTPGAWTLTPDIITKLAVLKTGFSELLGDVEDSPHYPYVPDDTYTMEFVAEVVANTGRYILNDEGDIEEVPEKIQKLWDILPDDEDKVLVERPVEDVVEEPEEKVIEESDCDLPNILKGKVKLSENFTLGDLTTGATFPHELKAQHGLSKHEIACNLKNVAINILEPLLAQYPNMQVNSGFRGTPSLKGRVSQHEIGQAVDVQFTGWTPQDYLEASRWVRKHLPFDQFIFEHGNNIWFHISCKKKNNRNKLTTMYKNKYEPGIKLYYT